MGYWSVDFSGGGGLTVVFVLGWRGLKNVVHPSLRIISGTALSLETEVVISSMQNIIDNRREYKCVVFISKLFHYLGMRKVITWLVAYAGVTWKQICT